MGYDESFRHSLSENDDIERLATMTFLRLPWLPLFIMSGRKGKKALRSLAKGLSNSMVGKVIAAREQAVPHDGAPRVQQAQFPAMPATMARARRRRHHR